MRSKKIVSGALLYSAGLLACAAGCHAVFPLSGAEPQSVSDGGSTFDASRADGGKDGLGAADSGSAEDSAVLPAPDLKPSQDPTAQFGTPIRLAKLSTREEDEDDPTLTADMLEIYFECDDNICSATRPTLQSPWLPPEIVTSLSTSEDKETHPEIAADGLTIYFASERSYAAEQGEVDIFRATRPAIGEPWSEPVAVQELNTASDDLGPVMAAVEPALLVYCVYGPEDVDDADLFTRRLQPGGVWGPPAGLALNTSHSECSPWIDPSATVLYFNSTRPGGPGDGDIWVATRQSLNVPFEPPTLVKGLNTGALEEDPWLSPDLRTIYFASKRDGTSDLFVATR